MENRETIENILAQIKDQSVKLIAEHALKSSRKALDINEASRTKQVVDGLDRIMPRALKLRRNNETT